MKAITLWQPWAWLVAEGLKQYETRSWATSYRGPLAIHAGKRKPRTCEINEHIEATIYHSGGMDALVQLGVVICIANLVDCIPTEKMDNVLTSNADEYHFGDFTPGRFAWKLANVRKIEPVAVNGAQGLWEWGHDR